MSVELSAAEAIASLDEIFSHSLFLSLLFLGEEMQKIFFSKSRRQRQLSPSPDARVFFGKKVEGGEGNRSVITLNVLCQLSSEFERHAGATAIGIACVSLQVRKENQQNRIREGEP